MNIEVSWVAVLLAGISSMVVGSIWYAEKVFGRTWKKLAKLDEKRMKSDAPKALLLAFALSMAEALVLAHVVFLSHNYFQHSYLYDALMTGFWMWLGFAMTSIVIHNTFEQKPMKLTDLAVANRFFTIMVMALIIGLIH